jgi:hypothetical protein
MRTSLYRVAPVRPHGDKQVTLSGILIAAWEHSQAQPLLPAETPLDAADIAHDGGDALADPLAKNWLPRHQL